jgi:hypothetical protein
MIQTTENLLEDLVKRNLLPQKSVEKLRTSVSECELSHLYYNPRDHKVGEPLRLIVSGIRPPTQNISIFLNHIIRSTFDSLILHSVSSSMEFFKHLKHHQTTPGTPVYTFGITDLYTMIPKQKSILAVCEMLRDYQSFFWDLVLLHNLLRFINCISILLHPFCGYAYMH